MVYDRRKFPMVNSKGGDERHGVVFAGIRLSAAVVCGSYHGHWALRKDGVYERPVRLHSPECTSMLLRTGRRARPTFVVFALETRSLCIVRMQPLSKADP